MKNFKNSIWLNLTVLILIYTGLSCSTDNDPGPNQPDLNTFEGVIDSGGSFEDFIESVDTITVQEDAAEIINGEEWKCTTKTYDLVDGNESFPLFNPNANVIYPGSLIQGKSLDKATPDVIVVKRAPGTISYDLVNANASPSFTVSPELTKSGVAEGMNNIIANSPDALPANFSLTIEEVQSTQELAFKMGVDVNTRFTEVQSDLSFSQDRSYTRFLVKLNQSYYTMSFDLPTSTDELFAPEVTPQDLARYVGSGNPAAYISDVTYGRIFYMLIESTDNSTKVEAAIRGSFNGLTKVEASAQASQMKGLSNLTIKVKAYGGDASGSIGLAGVTDIEALVNRLNQTSDIKNGLPISYVVRSALDNQIVNVKLATSYDVKTCVPAAPGRFEFLALQSLPLDLIGYKTLTGDVNGDGIDDLILNRCVADQNQIQVALGDASGLLNLTQISEYPDGTPDVGSWTDYDVKTGDFNGDGLTDLVWSNMIETPTDIQFNTNYTAFGQADGSYVFNTTPFQEERTWRTNFRFYVADLNGDKKDDLFFNALTSNNRTYIALADEEGFNFQDNPIDFSGSWSDYQVSVGDIDGDQQEDIVFERTGNTKTIYFVKYNGTTLVRGDGFTFAANGFTNYISRISDIDGDGRDDIILANTDSTIDIGGAVWLGFSDGTKVGTKKLSKGFNLNEESKFMKTLVADINRDGKSDIIWNDKGDLTNIVHVGLTKANVADLNENLFSFATAKQVHPDEGIDWNAFNDPMVADVNGDSKPDIIWVRAQQNIGIYVALAY
ncbi:MAG: thiol-activated cytolysin family protein [Bacteroidota bacterium]